MQKEAAVLVLDVSILDAVALREACDIFSNIITDKIIFASSDEVAVVLVGTERSRSTLFDISARGRFHHVSVAVELGPVSRRALEPIAATRADAEAPQRIPTQPYDFIEALRVAATLLHDRTSRRRYSRCIYFVSDARHAVTHKSELLSLMDSLRREQVTLVVVGVGFRALRSSADLEGNRSEVMAASSSANDAAGSWARWDVKVQNEMVLEALCTQLGPPSTLVSPADALASLSLLRTRKVRQQALLRVVLRIGDVRIATQIFTLAQREQMPVLRRCTPDGKDIMQTTEYLAISDGEESQRVVMKDERVESFLFGVDRLFCNEADREAMKVRGPRVLEAVAFVKETDIAPYLLMGGTRAVLPLAGDHAGQRGFDALVAAMQSCGEAMLVRFVRAPDAAPSLCVCFPVAGSPLPNPSFHLVMAPLPFAEDTRSFRFSEYSELHFAAAEERLMDELIDGLTVDASFLAPQVTYHPAHQQYYATLKAKLTSADLDVGQRSPKDAGPAVPLLPPLRGTSADFFWEGSAVQQLMVAHRGVLESCARTFPFEEEAEAVDNKTAPVGDAKVAGQKGCPWYHTASSLTTLLGGQDRGPPRQPSQGSRDAPSTVAAAAGGTLCGAPSRKEAQPGCSSASLEVSSIATMPHNATVAAAAEPFTVTTVNPVDDFHRILSKPELTAAQLEEAKDDLSDVIFDLLRGSLKQALYRKCLHCMEALRQCCVMHDDARYYTDFLLKLEVVAQQCGREKDFWVEQVVERNGAINISPITAQECKSATLPDDAAAEAFLRHDRFGFLHDVEDGITAVADDSADAEDDWLAAVQ